MGLVECCAGIWLPHVAPEGLSGVHALHLGYGSLGVQYPRGIMGNPWKSRFLAGFFWEICMDWDGFGIMNYECRLPEWERFRMDFLGNF